MEENVWLNAICCKLSMAISHLQFSIVVNGLIAMTDDRTHQSADKYIVRFPDGMRDQLKAAAKANNRSLNAEIVARLQSSFAEEPLTRIPSPPLTDYAQRAAIREQLQAREMAKTYGVGPAGEVAKEMFEKIRAEDEERFQKLVTVAVKSAVEQQAEAMKKGVYEELLRAIVGPKDQGQK